MPNVLCLFAPPCRSLFAHNTLVRVGSRSHLVEVLFGARSCDGGDGAWRAGQGMSAGCSLQHIANCAAGPAAVAQGCRQPRSGAIPRAGVSTARCCRRHAALRGQPRCRWLGPHLWGGCHPQQERVRCQQRDLQPARVQVAGTARPRWRRVAEACRPCILPCIGGNVCAGMGSVRQPLRLARAHPVTSSLPAVAALCHRQPSQLRRPRPARRAASG